MDIFWLIWFLVLPILGLTVPGLAIAIYVFVIPKEAKMLIWNRLRSVSIHAVADHSGHVELVATRESLPEGIVRTEKGWHFLPKPIYREKSEDDKTLDKETKLERLIEKIGLKKYIFMGKPFFFGHTGKMIAMNPGILAAMQETEKGLELKGYFKSIEQIVKDVPQHFRKALKEKLKLLKEATKAEPYTTIDIDEIKKVNPKMYPPSQIDALQTKSEMKGMKMAGKQYGGVILGGAIIIGLVILGIVAMALLL